MAMVIALLLAAIIWNFGTWYMAIPASSSHTLIGAIIGVGLANSYLVGHFGSGVNWKKAGEVGLSLLISPLIGFVLAALLLILLKKAGAQPGNCTSRRRGTKPPPWWVRGMLILTCTGVSFAHGSNDGQKGIGLIMLILIGLVPSHYAINMARSADEFQQVAVATKNIHEVISDPDVEKGVAKAHAAERRGSKSFLASLPSFESTANAQGIREKPVPPPAEDVLADPDLPTVQELVESLHNDLKDKESVESLDKDHVWQVRTKTLMIEHSLSKLQDKIVPALKEDKDRILRYNESRASLRGSIEYAPTWVLFAVALALGAGTMVGWKRIVVTIGEKIGKTHLTYSQGASAELVAMTTIGMADILGMPVSTTHVLSSGVAGTHGRQQDRPANVDCQEHRPGLDPDAAGIDAPGRHPLPAVPDGRLTASEHCQENKAQSLEASRSQGTNHETATFVRADSWPGVDRRSPFRGGLLTGRDFVWPGYPHRGRCDVSRSSL